MPRDQGGGRPTLLHASGLLLFMVAAAVLFAQGCDNPSLDELLAGKACDPTGACAPGYECDAAINRCVPFGTTISSGGGGAGGQGAGGGPPTCLSTSDCPPPQSPCEVPICVAGQCGYSALPMGTVAGAQTLGDCELAICDGLGGVVPQNDPADVPQDGKDCTLDLCNSGTPENRPLAFGEICDQDGGSFCDGGGNCVECLVASDCTSLPPDDECQTRTCTAGLCAMTFTLAGTLVTAQSLGDCQKSVCDGAGAIVAVDDDTDLPNDSNACTDDLCDMGTPIYAPVTQGAACGAAGTCDALGNCTGCTAASDCGTDSFCVQFACNAGVCAVSYTQQGLALPAAQQVAGDCNELQCNGVGGIQSANAATDLPPSDGNDCTAEACISGSPQYPPLVLNTSCSTSGGTFCNGLGACVECNSGSQCDNQGTICQSATCSGGQCGLQNTPNNTLAPAAAQVDGDCQVVLCNGTGGTKTQADDGDLPVDGKECTLDVCTNGVPSNPPLAAGTPCGNGGSCDASGNCTSGNKPNGQSCGSATECQSGFCADGVCCNTACGATCRACVASKTGATNGTCAFITAGQDPDVECPVSETCNGSGSCAFQCGQEPTPPGGGCPAVCNGGCQAGTCIVNCTTGQPCSGTLQCPSGFACKVQCGSGNSCSNVTVDCPARYACDVHCTGNCSGVQVLCDTGTCDLGCGNGSQCTGAALVCGLNACNATCTGGAAPSVACNGSCQCSSCLLGAGESCNAPAQCASGICLVSDGVCCATACSGLCQACVSTKTGVASGSCAPVVAGTDPDNECPGPNVCNGSGACN